MSDALTVEFNVRFDRKAKGRKDLISGPPPEATALPEGCVPRVARLMALAIHVDELIRTGAIKDYAEAARLGQVTRARMTQIMNLLNLAPDIQEALLCMPRTVRGRDAIGERQLRPIASMVTWRQQRIFSQTADMLLVLTRPCS
jgi:hypothetical protein